MGRMRPADKNNTFVYSKDIEFYSRIKPKKYITAVGTPSVHDLPKWPLVLIILCSHDLSTVQCLVTKVRKIKYEIIHSLERELYPMQ